MRVAATSSKNSSVSQQRHASNLIHLLRKQPVHCSFAYLFAFVQGTRVEKVINELFEGHTSNYLECVNVDYKSSRRESFMDLQLDVKGCANIYESFNK